MESEEFEFRPMGEDFVLPSYPEALMEAPLHPEDWKTVEPSRFPLENAEFYRRYVEKYGSCAILAWEGDLLIGCATFFPANDLPAGVGLVYGDELYPTEWYHPYLSERSALVIGAVTVAKGYRGLGIARELLQRLVDWARHHRWQRLLALGVNTELLGYNHRLALPFWLRHGWEILRTHSRSHLLPWSGHMQMEILSAHERGKYLTEGVDFSRLLRELGWDGILSAYDLGKRLETRTSPLQ